ncbi:MAG: hypothetical protein GXP15_17655 [Gammaproteobacteria bacterium]|nr:hypothetical protein [Gammaproteobacteria bacterium]
MKMRWLLLPLAIGAAALSYLLALPDTEEKSFATATAIATENGKRTLPLSDVQTHFEDSVVTDSESKFEIVHGIEVLKDRKCTVEKHYIDVGNGTIVEGYSCTPNEQREPNVYDDYDDATLAQMAYSDALAAEILGKRLAEDDPNRSRTLLLRSVALRPENTDPLRWLASVNYGLVSTNGVLEVGELSQNFLLTRVAEELGTTGAAANSRRRLVAAGLEDEDFWALEQEVLAELAHMRAVQVEVNGKSDLPEVSL